MDIDEKQNMKKALEEHNPVMKMEEKQQFYQQSLHELQEL